MKNLVFSPKDLSEVGWLSLLGGDSETQNKKLIRPEGPGASPSPGPTSASLKQFLLGTMPDTDVSVSSAACHELENHFRSLLRFWSWIFQN